MTQRQISATGSCANPASSASAVQSASMAVKAVVVDKLNTHHLVIGLSRENIESLWPEKSSPFRKATLTGLPMRATLCYCSRKRMKS